MCDILLLRKYRITKIADFNNVFRRGRFLDYPLFYIKYSSNNLKYSRFGFIVGTKIFKRAVQRNRVKRLMREVIRLNLNKIRAGYDILIGAKSIDIYEMSCVEVEKELLKFLSRYELFLK